MFKQYLGKILEVARRGDAREESHYSTLETLLIEFASSKGRKNIHVTSQPKKTDAGNPDFRVWDGKQRIVGYIEAKTPDKNLDDIEKTEQVKRYKTTFSNFVLTNFLEFRLFRNGLMIDKVRIADPVTIYSLKGTPFVEHEEQIENFLEKFFSFSFPSISSAETLAVELAKRTRFLRDEVIAEGLREDERNRMGQISGFYEAFQKYLIKGLTKEEFADLYSQTITYGLFTSRMRCGKEFNRRLAFDNVPQAIGILREMFRYISHEDLPPQLEWIVDDISNVLANVHEKIFEKEKDPIHHFYETFLAKYDPEEKERRGVYYTPKPVVSYIVRSLHEILKQRFGLEDGLASENVTLLDPAAGTLTFVAEAIKQAVKEFTTKYGEGGKKDFINEHVLNNFYAFELMIAPYAVGHLKISFLLEELGYKLQNEEMKFYLTNTLELEDIEQTSLPGMASLAEESRKAGEVKKKIPILVVLGNPPYSGISANMGKWITELIDTYKYVDGKHFGERKHWLHDDYVKFIRFAEWKINQAGKGVICYITNHSYLDNPTSRGMRQSLMKSFDEIFVLDLYGGGSSDRQSSLHSGKDENVFDITKGVAISFFVKEKGQDNECKVFYSEIWDTREEKYKWLNSHDKTTTEWKELHPQQPFYLFIEAMEEELTETYSTFWKITDIFPVNSVGVITARDKFATDFEKEALESRIKKFRNLSIPDEIMRKNFKLKDTSTFSLQKSREKLSSDREWDKHFNKILYRPFDVRHIYYTKIVLERPLYKTMRHMMQENLGMITARSNKSSVMNHFFCSEHMTETKCGEHTTQSYLFPLYLYTKRDKKLNLSQRLVELLEKTYSAKITPARIFYYIYAVFYSNMYREKYMKSLRIDFPRVPFTNDYNFFDKMTKCGKKLVDLHLMKAGELKKLAAKFQGDGDNTVEKPVYNKERKRSYINKTQYFEEIDKDVWEYQIGGYQILYKWLKYRKGRKLSLEDIKHFCKVATALKMTKEIQREIDELYPDVEKSVISFETEKVSIEKYTV